ncbi:hypothetical protein QBC38DRAFT_497766 [Podospora fimiseda]|uniref:AB hydrolase-1 domain-containing protein n=1 Tax=Podospora fimiseda TaxID=252190 RepID=A0AAN7BUI4_9PEZI|nr:hypothetical protein QBC38DRAFT_497766 [Podospora fimiseda]
MSAEVNPNPPNMVVDGAKTMHTTAPTTKTSVFRHAPLNTTTVNRYPIILIHSEHYTAQIWGEKPDGGNGWASDFVKAGFAVITPTLPLNGTPEEEARVWVEAGCSVKKLNPAFVEKMMTAPAQIKKAHWKNRDFHHQWPGTGRRGDPIFEKFMSMTVPTYLERPERETSGQEALVEILHSLDKRCILIGHGSGANLAWLAADMDPAHVAAIIAVEPLGPPFGNGKRMTAPNRPKYTPNIPEPEPTEDLYLSQKQPRKYGIADIPLTFDPPLEAPTSFVDELLTERHRPLPYKRTLGPLPGERCFLQDTGGDPPRRLVNLQKIPQAVWTATSSFHVAFDWATVEFLKEAGVPCDHLTPNRATGNGHLCFLEKNSSSIAKSIMCWIKAKLGDVSPRASKNAGQPPNQGQPIRVQPGQAPNPAQRQPANQSHILENAATARNQAPTQIRVPTQAQLAQDSAALPDNPITTPMTFGHGLVPIWGTPYLQAPAATAVNREQNPSSASTANKVSKDAKPRGKKRGPYKKTLVRRALAAAQAAAASDPSQVAAENRPPSTASGSVSGSSEAAVAPTSFMSASFAPMEASAPDISFTSGFEAQRPPDSQESAPILPSLPLGPQLTPKASRDSTTEVPDTPRPNRYRPV